VILLWIVAVMEFVISLEERISSSSKSGKRLSFLTPSAPGNQGSRKLSGNIQRSFCLRRVISPSQNYSDWGLLCFRVTEQNTDGEYPVYRWDHERPEKFEFFATDLRSALEREAMENA